MRAFASGSCASRELAASIDHPNIIPIYDAGEDDGRLLHRDALRRGDRPQGAPAPRTAPLEPTRALADHLAGRGRARRCARARPRPPRHQAVERPARPDARPRLPVGLRPHQDAPPTRVGSPRTGLVGTVDYVAPEQIRSEEVDGRTDIYSLGCLLFECLTGEVPFAHASEVAVVYSQLEEEPPRPSERIPGLPIALDTVLARAMAKLPDDRYATCRDLVDAAADSLGLVAAPSKLAGRQRWQWLVIAAVAVVAAAIGGWLLTRTAGSAAPPGTDALVGSTRRRAGW